MTSRPSWDETFLDLATVIARRGTCNRGYVGAVVVDAEGHIVSTGYNGSPSGVPHCTEAGCHMVEGHCRRTVHAEANAIYNAQDRGLGERLRGSTVYVTHFPCPVCATLLVRSRVARVVALAAYGGSVDPTTQYLSEHGIRSEVFGGKQCETSQS